MKQAIAIFAFSFAILACSRSGDLDATQAGTTAPPPSMAELVEEKKGSPNGFTESNALVAEAQEMYEANNGIDPEDECEIDGNWKYEVLSILSQAAELSPAQTINYLSKADFGFKGEAAYIKWHAAVTSGQSHDSLKALLISSEWWPMVSSFPLYWVEFAENGRILIQTFEEESKAGSWRLDQSRLLLTLENKGDVQLEPATVKSYFNEGSSWYFSLTLKRTNPDVPLPWDMPLILGPPAGDCSEYNY